MGKFDTHGGYFAPKGYLRINTGGSHEENPNGGVQLGQGPDGIPNMVEENEPVYNDFVYSDNIRATPEMLAQFKLPEKFAGKLYSEIADYFVDEASTRPNDAISNNGLNAMLVRLADAQEAQKAAEEEAEMNAELEGLSPEEQQALLQLFAEDQANQQAALEQGEAQQQMPVDPAAVAQTQMPTMANGGLLRTFGDGSPGDVVPVPQTSAAGTASNLVYDPETGYVIDTATGIVHDPIGGGSWPANLSLDKALAEVPTANDDYAEYSGGEIEPAVATAFPGKSQAWVDAEVGPRSIKRQVSQAGDEFLRDAWDMYQNNPAAQTIVPLPKLVGDVATDIKNKDWDSAAQDALLAAAPFMKVGKGANAVRSTAGDLKKIRRKLIGIGALMGVGAGVNLLDNTWGHLLRDDKEPVDTNVVKSNPAVLEYMKSREKVNEKSRGGCVRRFDDGGLAYDSRYAVPLVAVATGLSNLAQRPTNFSLPNYNPTLISGNMPLTNMVYRPADTNQSLYAADANTAALRRSIANSGAGPSIGATLLAANYNGNLNRGNVRNQTVLANLESLNTIINQNNANSQARAKFYTGISEGNASLRSKERIQDRADMITLQRLNDAAETQKYTALGNQIDQMAKSLAAIGKENQTRNLVNALPTDYKLLANNLLNYIGTLANSDSETQQGSSKYGGKITRKKK